MPQPATIPDRSRVVVIGGGLAGLAAASILARRGLQVTLLESRPRLGGRASSIVDRETGQVIDNCQHVAMGCCTSFRHFCEMTGCADLFETQQTLHFVAPASPGRSPRIVPFRGHPLPAPAHLALSLARMPWFTFAEKRAVARGLRMLSRDRHSESNDSAESFAEWLTRNGQPETVQQRFWHTVLVSALSETLDRISVWHARKVFVDGFLSNRSGWEVSIPTAPLGEIYDGRIARALTAAGVEIRTGSGITRVLMQAGRVTAVELRDGTLVTGDEFVLSVPHWVCRTLLPADFLRSLPAGDTGERAQDSGQFADQHTGSVAHSSLEHAISQIETAPIASAHLWFDQPLTDLPHAVLLDRTSQWFFNHSHKARTGSVAPDDCDTQPSAPGKFYCQVVISAAGQLSSCSESDILDTVEAELKSIWPGSRQSTRLHGRVLTEHRAVFAPLPGVDAFRPAQQSAAENLQLAGDWTQTGWPSTMEGAVRSGFLAARNILVRQGGSLELPGALPQSLMFRLLFT